MNVLGIETSCDETSAAVVKDGRKILANVVSSSLGFHKIYGGVIPEIASRRQLETISAVAQQALEKAGMGLKSIDLVCFTREPGLPGSLLVGLAFAKAVSLARGIPLLGVDHVLSHIYASLLEEKRLSAPFVSLVVSGGHTSLFFVRDFARIEALGRTRDDACGEAFDKVARILGLGYPGGPEIEKAARRGDAKKIRFNCSGTDDPLDFSFSGIKTAVLYYMKEHFERGRNHPILFERAKRVENSAYRSPRFFSTRPDRIRRDSLEEYSRTTIRDVAASFQEVVIEALIKKSLLACALKKSKRLVIGGGVAANARLREKFRQACGCAGIECYFPSRGLCTDNAAMVAGLGYQFYKSGRRVC